MIKQEKKLHPHRTPGIAELAYFLGFDSRQSLYDQEKRGDKFSYITKRARLRCQVATEKDLAEETGNPTKHIYKLNAMNYHKDASTKSTRIGGNVNIILTNKKPDLTITADYKVLTDED